MADRFSLNFQEYFRTTTNETRRLAGRKFRQIAEAYADEFVNGPWLERANRRLALIMQEGTVTAYRTNVLAEKVAPSYREGQGRFPGALLEVLESSNFAVGNRTGIAFANLHELNERAVFWARLNFGAAPAVGSRPALTGNIRFGSGQGFSLRLTDPPSRGFSVPERPARIGFFNQAGQFFPFAPKGGLFPLAPIDGKSNEATIVASKPSTRGIGARRFLDAGLVALAANFNIVYKEELDDAARAARARATRAII